MNGLLAFLLLYPVAAVVRGITLTLLWGWYVVPTFGVPTLTLVPAIGLSILVGMLTAGASTSEDTDIFGSMSLNIIFSLTCLAFGWVWTFFL